MTALTLAGEALRGGWDVYWIDGKAHPATAGAFLTLARAAGVEAHDGTRDPLDGWRGDPEAIVNRLLATQTFTESYYEGIARTVSDRPGAAVDLVERARSFNVAVVLIAQTWASLGSDDTIRNRLAGTVGTVIAHQLKQPDDIAALAGTEWILERTEQTQTLDHTGLGTQRAGNRYVVHPDDIRRLYRGEAFIIHGGHALKVRVRPPGPAA